MLESGYYPPGAEFDPNAPYNQSDPDPVDVEVCISTSLSRSTTISVDDYTAEEWEDYEPGDEGEIIHDGGIDYDFSNCNLKGAYTNQEYTILELLSVLKEYVQADIDGSFHSEGRHCKRILQACEGWNEDELEVIVE